MTKVTIINTPTEKIIGKTNLNHIVQDSLGRSIKIKIPDALDEFDLHSALGNDSANMGCLAMGGSLLYVAEIDTVPFIPPHSYADVRAGIKRLGKEGMKAVLEAIKELNIVEDNDNQVKEIKKL
jgi:hypothetical protein